MKRLLTLAMIIVPLLSSAQDDMYFTPSKKVKNQSVRVETPVRTTARPEVVDYNSSSRSEDDYNRRYSYNGSDRNAGAQEVDTAAYDMEDPEIDYRYSRRLVRFHSPRYYAMCSPYYWDLMYSYGAWDYIYDVYDPWYWSYGWGYGYSWGPWDCWYGGIWGYHHYNHWAYWGWGPGWHHYYNGYLGAGHYSSHYRPRGEYATNSRNGSRGGYRVGGTSVRTNPAASRGGQGVSYRSNTTAGSRGMLTTRTSDRPSQRAGVSNPYGTRGSQGVNATNSRSSADRYNQRYSGSNSSRSSVNVGSSSRQTTTSRSNANTSSRSNSSYTPSRSSSSSSSSSSFSSGGSRGGGSYSGGGFSGGGSRSGGGRR